MTTPQSVVRMGRAAAERNMTDQVRIVRAGTGEPVFNPETGKTELPVPELVYAGKALLFTAGPAATIKNLGEAPVTVQTITLTIPVGAVLRPGDRVQWWASFDPTNVGREFTVTSSMRKTFAVSERAVLEEVL